MSARKKIILNAIWQYLNQPLFTVYPDSIWRFNIFWYHYKVQFLERCLLSGNTSESQHY
jgi:hypothetical protein